MPDRIKPRHRSGYGSEEFEQVRAACLTLAVTLGAYLEDVCIVGGLVPSLLIDAAEGRSEEDERHPGTNDLDVGLALAVLNGERYTEISSRLRAEGFKPDNNDAGSPTVQRWRLGQLTVTVDFLMPPAPNQGDRLRVQKLEGDFGALVTPGLEVAFDERVSVELTGHTLHGEPVTREIPVCGPAAFVLLKALAFGDRAEPKDAFDLIYVIRHTSGGGQAIAERLAEHAEKHEDVVKKCLQLLVRDFAEVGNIGPTRAALFGVPVGAKGDQLDDATADAHGYVADLLAHALRLGLIA